MALSKEAKDRLALKMDALGIQESDLIEKFILGSGSGGQKINKTSSCVYLKHIPSGIEIKCQQDRSRELNRYYARQELCQRIETLTFKEKSKKQQEIAKIRRQKKRRSRKAQEKVLASKKQRSNIKTLRKIDNRSE
jgi:protein subunit release factor B